MATTFLQQISEAAPTLSRSERRVADHVLDDPDRVVTSTLAALATEAGVSEPTVVRFCTRLGFSGFQDFRSRMAQFVTLGVPAAHSQVTPDDPVESVATKLFDHTIASLDHTRRSLDGAAVAAAVALVAESTRLHFFGFGASAVIARDAAQKAPLFGRPCSAVEDPHQQFMAAATAEPGDLFVLISYTGVTVPLPEVAAEARRNGAKVVALTGSATSPLAEASDLAVVTATLDDTDRYTPTISRITGLVVVDVLATSTAVRADPEHAEALTAMKHKLAGFRAHLAPDTAG